MISVLKPAMLALVALTSTTTSVSATRLRANNKAGQALLSKSGEAQNPMSLQMQDMTGADQSNYDGAHAFLEEGGAYRSEDGTSNIQLVNNSYSAKANRWVSAHGGKKLMVAVAVVLAVIIGCVAGLVPGHHGHTPGDVSPSLENTWTGRPTTSVVAADKAASLKSALTLAITREVYNMSTNFPDTSQVPLFARQAQLGNMFERHLIPQSSADWTPVQEFGVGVGTWTRDMAELFNQAQDAKVDTIATQQQKAVESTMNLISNLNGLVHNVVSKFSELDFTTNDHGCAISYSVMDPVEKNLNPFAHFEQRSIETCYEQVADMLLDACFQDKPFPCHGSTAYGIMNVDPSHISKDMSAVKYAITGSGNSIPKRIMGQALQPTDLTDALIIYSQKPSSSPAAQAISEWRNVIFNQNKEFILTEFMNGDNLSTPVKTGTILLELFMAELENNSIASKILTRNCKMFNLMARLATGNVIFNSDVSDVDLLKGLQTLQSHADQTAWNNLIAGFEAIGWFSLNLDDLSTAFATASLEEYKYSFTNATSPFGGSAHGSEAGEVQECVKPFSHVKQLFQPCDTSVKNASYVDTNWPGAVCKFLSRQETDDIVTAFSKFVTPEMVKGVLAGQKTSGSENAITSLLAGWWLGAVSDNTAFDKSTNVVQNADMFGALTGNENLFLKDGTCMQDTLSSKADMNYNSMNASAVLNMARIFGENMAYYFADPSVSERKAANSEYYSFNKDALLSSNAAQKANARRYRQNAANLQQFVKADAAKGLMHMKIAGTALMQLMSSLTNYMNTGLFPASVLEKQQYGASLAPFVHAFLSFAARPVADVLAVNGTDGNQNVDLFADMVKTFELDSGNSNAGGRGFEQLAENINSLTKPFAPYKPTPPGAPTMAGWKQTMINNADVLKSFAGTRWYWTAPAGFSVTQNAETKDKDGRIIKTSPKSGVLTGMFVNGILQVKWEDGEIATGTVESLNLKDFETNVINGRLSLFENGLVGWDWNGAALGWLDGKAHGGWRTNEETNEFFLDFNNDPATFKFGATTPDSVKTAGQKIEFLQKAGSVAQSEKLGTCNTSRVLGPAVGFDNANMQTCEKAGISNVVMDVQSANDFMQPGSMILEEIGGQK